MTMPGKLSILVTLALALWNSLHRGSTCLLRKQHLSRRDGRRSITNLYRQIAAKYGEATAADAVSRSSFHMGQEDGSPFANTSRRGSSYGHGQGEYEQPALRPRNDSFGATGSPLAQQSSRAPSTHSTGYNSQAGSGPGALYDPASRRDSYTDVAQAVASANVNASRPRVQSNLNPQANRDTTMSAYSSYSEAERYRDAAADGQGYGRAL